MRTLAKLIEATVRYEAYCAGCKHNFCPPMDRFAWVRFFYGEYKNIR